MALLTRKGGGLPANYREVYFWLNHAEEPVEEQGQAARQTAAAAAASEAAEVAAAETAPAEQAPEAKAADGLEADATTETVAAAPVESAEAGHEAGVEDGEAVEAQAAEVAAAEEPNAESPSTADRSEAGPKLVKVRELPKRGGTILGLNADPVAEQTTQQDANEGAAEAGEAEEKARSRGFLGLRRKKRA